MTIRKAIANADRARPNMIEEETKAAWIYELEAEFAELMQLEPPVNEWSNGGSDAELLVAFPHDKVYELYLMAMIDNYNMETAAYANDLVIATAAIDAAKAYYNRRHLPKKSKNNYWAVM